MSERERRVGLPDIVALLSCPGCRSGLKWEDDRLSCRTCGAEYPVVDGIPVLLPDGAAREVERSRERPARRGLRSRLVAGLSPGGASYDPGQTTRIQAMLDRLGPTAFVLDLGCGGRCWGPRVIGMDLAWGAGVGLIGDGRRLPFPAGALDGLICTGVLEHVDDADVVVREIHRVLRAGGLGYIAIPFMQGFHPATGTEADYRRLTQPGLRRVLRDFEILESGIAGGPSSAVGWILREYLAMLLPAHGPLAKLAHFASGWLTAWIKYLDVVVARRPMAHRIASGFYALVRKPDRV